MIKDPIVEKVHRIREKMAAEAGYDVREIFKRIKESEKRSGRKFVRLSPKRISSVSSRRA